MTKLLNYNTKSSIWVLYPLHSDDMEYLCKSQCKSWATVGPHKMGTFSSLYLILVYLCHIQLKKWWWKWMLNKKSAGYCQLDGRSKIIWRPNQCCMNRQWTLDKIIAEHVSIHYRLVCLTSDNGWNSWPILFCEPTYCKEGGFFCTIVHNHAYAHCTAKWSQWSKISYLQLGDTNIFVSLIKDFLKAVDLGAGLYSKVLLFRIVLNR